MKFGPIVLPSASQVLHASMHLFNPASAATIVLKSVAKQPNVNITERKLF